MCSLSGESRNKLERNKNTMAPVKCGRKWLGLCTVKDTNLPLPLFSSSNGVFLVPRHVALCAVLFLFYCYQITSPLDYVRLVPFSGTYSFTILILCPVLHIPILPYPLPFFINFNLLWLTLFFRRGLSLFSKNKYCPC